MIGIDVVQIFILHTLGGVDLAQQFLDGYAHAGRQFDLRRRAAEDDLGFLAGGVNPLSRNQPVRLQFACPPNWAVNRPTDAGGGLGGQGGTDAYLDLQGGLQGSAETTSTY